VAALVKKQRLLIGKASVGFDLGGVHYIGENSGKNIGKK